MTAQTGSSFYREPVMTETTRRLAREYDQVADRIVAAALRLRAERVERRVVTPEQHNDLAATVYGVLRHAGHADGERLCAEVAQAVLKAGWHR